MDLRGFTAQNAGCVFEIKELINVVPLGRVKFIADRTTDEHFLQRVVQQSWGEMSGFAEPQYAAQAAGFVPSQWLWPRRDAAASQGFVRSGQNGV